MTKEEAIKYLIKPVATSTEIGEEKQKEFEAYNMAIEALSADAVSREECNCVFSKPKIKLPKKAVEFNFSNVEVVVRCKDCKYFELDHFDRIDDMPIITAHEICTKWNGGCKTSKDGFCFMGERREPCY